MFSRYVEQGYSVIPLVFSEKYPRIENWSKYCSDLPTIKDLELWDSWAQDGKCGIGLCLGSQSRLIALDIDTDDEEILRVFPDSPVKKRGLKGETRFFKYNENIKNIPGPFFDLLSHGRQTVLPPSIHPKTGKPYEWMGASLLGFDWDHLPEFDLDRFNSAIKNDKAKEIKLLGEGRNNRLKRIASAMLTRGESYEHTVLEVHYSDKHFSSPPLFSDTNEAQMSSGDSMQNAAMFVLNIMKTVLIAKKLPLPTLDITLTQAPVDDSYDIDYESLDVDYPEPVGALKDVYDFINRYSSYHNPALAFGAALSVCATYLSGRIGFLHYRPNVYSYNLAPTGSGKSFPQIVATELAHKAQGDRRGFSNSYATTSYIDSLEFMRSRLDVIDEGDHFIKDMRKGTSFQQGLLKTILTLFSCASDVYLGPKLRTHPGKAPQSLTFRHPHVSLLLSGTPVGLEKVLDIDFITNGFAPRFLYFVEQGYGNETIQYNYDRKDADFERVLLSLKSLEETYPLEFFDTVLNDGYKPVMFRSTDDGRAFFEELRRGFYEETSTSRNEVTKSFYARASEHTGKLALIHAALLGKREIDVESFSWGRGVWEASFRRVGPLLDVAQSENPFQRNMGRVLQWLQVDGSKKTHREVLRRFRSLRSQDLDPILLQLRDMGEVELEVVGDGRFAQIRGAKAIKKSKTVK